MKTHKRDWLVGILLLAAGLRLWRLATVPFGWHPDEATKALLALDVLSGKAGFPAFFSAFTGRESLFVYLEAGLIALLGNPMFAGRLLSAFGGILTVALSYAVGRELFNRRVGVLTAVFLTLSLWHLIASRNGYRAIIQPLVQLPAIWLLFHGWRSGQWRHFLWAGLFLGLTQYTYTAVRLFPFLILAIVGLALLLERRLVTGYWWKLVGTAVVALLIFLPLGLHFWQNPLDFYGRAAQVSVFSDQFSGGNPAARLWQSAKETGRMFTIWGDINYRFNIAGQPVFDPPVGILFYAGLLLAAVRLWTQRQRQRLAYATLFAWMALMLLPMLLSAESLPYYQRAIGILPAVYIFPALVGDKLARGWETRRLGDWRLHFLVSQSLSLILFFYLTLTLTRDYFIHWHTSPQNDDDRRVAMVYVADYLQRHVIHNSLYLSTQYPQHPTLALLASAHYDGIHWFDATQALPLPNQPATYILLAENAPQPLLLARAAGLEWVETAVDRFHRPVFDVYQLNTTAQPPPSDLSPAVWSWETRFAPGDPDGLRHSIELPVNFGNTMTLLGHDRTEASTPGSVLELVLYWTLHPRPDRHYIIFAHLLNAEGQVIAGYDANHYPAQFWQASGGERLLTYFPLWIPPDAPPGTYQVEIGVYYQPTGERLPILQGETAVADRLLLQPLELR